MVGGGGGEEEEKVKGDWWSLRLVGKCYWIVEKISVLSFSLFFFLFFNFIVIWHLILNSMQCVKLKWTQQKDSSSNFLFLSSSNVKLKEAHFTANGGSNNTIRNHGLVLADD